MTDRLYWLDSYVKGFDTKVVSAAGKELVMEKTGFYPAGGGQPNDRGRITVRGIDYNVVDLKKNGDDIIHVLDREVTANPGDIAKGVIDWDHRYACMRYHTALHTLDGVIETIYKSGMITGGQIYPTKARIDIDMPDLNRGKVAEIIDKTNKICAEGHRIMIREIPQKEALEIQSLSRTGPGREMLKTLKQVRIVEIEGLDIQADGGTHVANTKEIGNINLSNYENKGAKRKRIEITLS